MVKSASFIHIQYCPNCRDPHIVLMDEHEEPFAEAVLSGRTGLDFVNAMQVALHRSAIEKGEITPISDCA
jgi:hypothetical protein